jgi:hypothetical protein
VNGQKISHEKRLDRSIKIVFRQSTNGRDANRVRDGTRLSPLVRKHFKADSYFYDILTNERSEKAQYKP